jgi:HSP20 family protein
MESTSDAFKGIADVLRAINQTVQNIERIPKELVREYETQTGKAKRVGPIVYGYSVSTLDGKPIVREFGNVRSRSEDNVPVVVPEMEPLIDVIASGNVFKVIAEMPGLSKEHIKLDAHDSIIEISTDSSAPRKYRQQIEIPPDADIKTAKSKYTNGILEIVFDKKDTAPKASKKKNKRSARRAKRRS